MEDNDLSRNMGMDGHLPLQKGYTPKIVVATGTVTGGHTPTTGQIAVSPPTGGSGVKPPPEKK
jgi:hypothetical protein